MSMLIRWWIRYLKSTGHQPVLAPMFPAVCTSLYLDHLPTVCIINPWIQSKSLINQLHPLKKSPKRERDQTCTPKKPHFSIALHRIALLDMNMNMNMTIPVLQNFHRGRNHFSPRNDRSSLTRWQEKRVLPSYTSRSFWIDLADRHQWRFTCCIADSLRDAWPGRGRENQRERLERARKR